MGSSVLGARTKPLSQDRSSQYRSYQGRSLLRSRYSFLLLLLLLWASIFTPSQVFAQQPAAEASPAPAPATSATPESSPSPTVTPLELVPALGEWVYREAQPKPKTVSGQPASTPHDFTREDAEERKIFEQLLQRYERKPVNVTITTPLIKRTVLNKDQRKRIEKASKIQRRRLWKQHKFIKALNFRRDRGLPEIRICTLNLNNYAEKEEQMKVVRSKVIKGYKRREKSIIKSIHGSGCSVVAVQGVVGTSYKRAKQGFNTLAEMLQKKSRWKWRAYLGESNHRLAYNGFLVSDYNIEVLTVRPHSKANLLRSGIFSEESFARGPFEIELKVKTQNSGTNKRLQLINFHFQDSLDSKKRPVESYRMQMAEALRRLVVDRQSEFAGRNPPILILLGDRSSGRTAPTVEIIEGRLQLKSFFAYGSCNLKELPKPEAEEAEEEEEGKQDKKSKGKKNKAKDQPDPVMVADCSADARGPKLLFGLSGENLVPGPRVIVRDVDGEKKYFRRKKEIRAARKRLKQEREQSSEIYLLASDLAYARPDGAVLNYSMGRKAVDTGLVTSPLVWTELNWQ